MSTNSFSEERLDLIREVHTIRLETEHYCWGVLFCVPCREKAERLLVANRRYQQAIRRAQMWQESERPSGVQRIVDRIQEEYANRVG